MKRFAFLFALALAATPINPSTASAQTFADTDLDGINDADEAEGCVDETQRGLDVSLIDLENPENYGCYVSTEACVAARLLRGGNSLDCDGVTAWNSGHLELFRNLTVRQRRDGTIVTVAGNSVTRRGDDLSCADPSSYLYAGGLVAGPDGAVEDSAFPVNSPPFCAANKFERRAVVAATTYGVSREEVDEAIADRTGALDAELEAIEARLGGRVASATSGVRGEVKLLEGRVAVIEGHFGPEGRVTRLAKLLTRTLGIAQEAHSMATEARRHRVMTRTGMTFSSLDVADGKVGATRFQRRVNPMVGWRVLELGLSTLPTDRFYLDVTFNLDLFFMDGGEDEGMAPGVGLGGQVTAAGVVVRKDAILVAIGGGFEAMFRLHNPGQDLYVLSETVSLTPRGGLIVVCGKDRRFVTSLMAGPAGHVINWSDGTFLSTDAPTFEIDATLGVRF